MFSVCFLCAPNKLIAIHENHFVYAFCETIKLHRRKKWKKNKMWQRLATVRIPNEINPNFKEQERKVTNLLQIVSFNFSPFFFSCFNRRMRLLCFFRSLIFYTLLNVLLWQSNNQWDSRSLCDQSITHYGLNSLVKPTNLIAHTIFVRSSLLHRLRCSQWIAF